MRFFFSTGVWRIGYSWESLLLVGLLLVTLVVAAAGFRVIDANTRLQEGVYRLNAIIDYDLSPAALDALQNGVPLTISLEMEVMRKRQWILDDTLASLQQRFRLEYHTLAQQYLVANLNSGEYKSFPTRGSALEFLGQVRDFPLLDRSLLDPGEQYYVRMRAILDIESLPAPLRPLAYLSGDWRLASEWYIWPL